MLGNQFFMARNFLAAEKELTPCLQQDPESKPVRRKLIICYTQLGEISKALHIFDSLVRDDIKFIINADPILDDCPCPELVSNKENFNLIEDSDDYLISSGILWLYCDIENSIQYFKKALIKDPNNELMQSALKNIEKYHKSHPVKN